MTDARWLDVGDGKAMNIIPGRGIEISLAEYHRLRAFHGGGEFWQRDYQDLIRNQTGLHQFLPHVEEYPASNTAVFQLMVDRKDVASRSRDGRIGIRDIPRTEIDALKKCLE